MSTFNLSSSCVMGLQKACVAYTMEIMSELHRTGAMSSEQLGLASGLMSGSSVVPPVKSLKKKKAKVDTPAILIPFCGEVNENWCCGVRVNDSLYTQCCKVRSKDEVFCKTCLAQSENSPSGKPNGGDIRDRVSQGAAWKSPKGKTPITYATLLSKAKYVGKPEYSWAAGTVECLRFGWTIPTSELELASKGRKKKVVVVSDTDSDEDEGTRKRGRPKKVAAEKQELSDLIKEQALTAVAEMIFEVTDKPVTKKVKRVKKVVKVKKPSQKALKMEATRLKLLKELTELQPLKVVSATSTSVELRALLKTAKVEVKEAGKVAKKALAEKLIAEKAAAKVAKKAEAEKLKADKLAAKLKLAADKEAKKSAKLSETNDKKLSLIADITKLSSTELTVENTIKELRDALKVAKRVAKEASKIQVVVAGPAKPELEIEEDSSDDEEELEDLSLPADMTATAYPFNPTTGLCISPSDAGSMDIDYYAECSKTSFPNPIPDDEGDVCLYDGSQELIATFTDGEVVAVEIEEE